MTSNNQPGGVQPDDDQDADDVTLPAGGDVVAQIRAHAAKVRRGEIHADEELEVWTQPVEDAPTSEPAEPEPKRFVGVADRPLLPNDDTVAFTEGDSIIDLTAAPELAPVVVPVASTAIEGESLIEGLTPPNTSADFWGPDRRFGASSTDRKARPARGSLLPFWAWVVLTAVLIVAVSIGIALTVATVVPFA